MSSDKNRRRVFWVMIILLAGLLIPWQRSDAVGGPVAWTSKGPFGGNVRAIAINPVHPDILYAGTSGGVYRSDDGGLHWRLASEDFTGYIISALVIDPDRPDELYAGTQQHGVFKSTDAGATWKRLDFGMYASPTIKALTIVPPAAPNGPMRLYAGTTSSLLRSLNRGVTWQRLRYFSYINAITVHPQQWWIVYVGTDSGLYKSVDDGEHWTPIGDGIPEELDIQSLAIDPQTPSTLYAGTYGGGVYKSVDDGLTWAPSYQGIENSFIYDLVIDPQTPMTLYAGTDNGVFTSEDGGASWHQVANASVNALMLSPADHRTIYAGVRDQGMLKSEDAGATWDVINQGLANRSVSVILPSPVEAGSFLVGGSHLWLWNRSQNTWRETTYPNGVVALVQQADAPQTLIAASSNHIYKSEDGGITWREMATVGINRVLAMHPRAPQTLYIGTWSAVYKSSDGGETWHQTTLTDVVVGDILLDPDDPQIVYVGAWSGDKMYKSEDGGATWRVINHGITRSGVRALAMAPDDSKVLYAGTPGQLFKSEDAGENWRAVGDDTLGFTYFDALVFDARAPKTLYAATYTGLFQSVDGGEHWQRLGLGKGQEITTLLPDPDNRNLIYVGAGANGLYEGRALTQRLHLPMLRR